MLINIKELVEERLCYEKVRELRWAEGVKCPHCTSQSYKRHGHHNSCEHRYRYQCKNCHKYYDDLTMTVFEGHHQPLKVWILCLYFMGLNLSNTQIAKELDLNESDIQIMCNTLRSKTVELKPSPILENEVEIDEVYIVSGHKGNSQAVKKKNRKPRCRRLKGKRGRGTAADDKVPILGMIQRDGQVVLKMLNDVKIKTITLVIKTQIKQYSKIYTDEYAIYNWLSDFYCHKTVNHGRKEYARDDDNDGFCEVHVNTCEGVWSLLRSWLRPHRGISQEKLPFYIGFFEVIHNARKRGKAVLHQLLTILL